MGSSMKINNRVDMSGKRVTFNTKETDNKTPNKRVVNRKFNMEKIVKNALGSIPYRILVNGNLEQRVETDFLKMGQGSIPTVAGILTKTEIDWMYNENGKMRTVWKQIGGKCYYFHEDGHMAKSEKIQGEDGRGYVIDENGVCILSLSRGVDEKIKNFMEGTIEIGNWHTKDAKYIPKRGDILVQHEYYGKENVKHVEIVDSYDGKEAKVWSWGKVYKSLPAPRTKSELCGSTSGYWRIEK